MDRVGKFLPAERIPSITPLYPKASQVILRNAGTQEGRRKKTSFSIH
jgi:hypothetical protein